MKGVSYTLSNFGVKEVRPGNTKVDAATWLLKLNVINGWGAR